MDTEIRYARTDDGVDIAYAVFGEGPLVVYASTIWGTLHMAAAGVLGRRAQVDQLVALGWRVALYDCRGTGASEREVADFSLDARVRDLEAVVGQLGEQRFVLTAEFLGTPTAIEFAARNPDRVSHLVLANPVACGAEYYATIPTMGMIDALRGMADEQWEFFTQSLASAVGGFSDVAETQAVAAMMRSGMKPAAFGAFRDAAEKIDVSARLPLLRTAALIVRDESRFSTSKQLARKVAAGIPGAKFVTTDQLSLALAEFVSGHAVVSPASRPEPSVRTVLFSDIVAHTEMMQRLGDRRGREVLRDHERITRETLARYGGAEVKALGDGFFASFGSVTRAADCAIAMQRAFASYSESGPEAIGVRIGLNAGEPIEEGDDLFGATVILASRIAAKAGAGEILIPETLRHLLAGKSYLYADRGDVLLKGFEDAVRLFEVRWRE